MDAKRNDPSYSVVAYDHFGNLVEEAVTAREPSSVFFTPPDSTESIFPKCLSRLGNEYSIPKPSFVLDDVDEIEERSTLKMDLLKLFCDKSLVTTVCSNILARLDERDLLSASGVSKTWYMLIRSLDIKSGHRLRRFLRKAKTNFISKKENLHLQTVKMTPILRSPLSRCPENVPLVAVAEKTCSDLRKSDFDSGHTPDFLRPSTELYHQCPDCQSPSRTAFRQVGHCNRCNQDFCLHCWHKNQMHSPSCPLSSTSSGLSAPTSPQKVCSGKRQYSVGMKKNKERLKRL